MKNIARLMFVALLMMGATISGKAHVYVGDGGNDRGSNELKQTTAGCSPSSAFEWLNINNVRTRINAGGDMWWDLPGGIGAQYFIPANGSATSLFAGALWIAGLDINNQLKCAAVRFRQGPDLKGGNDFWTGPLTLVGAAIDEFTCAQWDQVFKITRAEVMSSSTTAQAICQPQVQDMVNSLRIRIILFLRSSPIGRLTRKSSVVTP